MNVVVVWINKINRYLIMQFIVVTINKDIKVPAQIEIPWVYIVAKINKKFFCVHY